MKYTVSYSWVWINAEFHPLLSTDAVCLPWMDDLCVFRGERRTGSCIVSTSSHCHTSKCPYNLFIKVETSHGPSRDHSHELLLDIQPHPYPHETHVNRTTHIPWRFTSNHDQYKTNANDERTHFTYAEANDSETCSPVSVDVSVIYLTDNTADRRANWQGHRRTSSLGNCRAGCLRYWRGGWQVTIGLHIWTKKRLTA